MRGEIVRGMSDMSGERGMSARGMSGASGMRGMGPHASHDPHASHAIPPPSLPAHAPAPRIIGAYGGYRRALSFGYACLIYHATTLFCSRNYSYKNDPLGKITGQMVGAARSARQNIVEGSSRAGTSKETELRLYDVAKGSLEELAGDYEAFLVDSGVAPWADDDSRRTALSALVIDPYEGSHSRHDFCEYVLAMRKRFAAFLESEDPIAAANAMLVVIDRACGLLHRQMQAIGEIFAGEGGFTERLSKARLAVRDAGDAAQGAPSCPDCGGPMRKMTARKGRNAGKPFWSCCDYPHCHGTRPWGKGAA